MSAVHESETPSPCSVSPRIRLMTGMLRVSRGKSSENFISTGHLVLSLPRDMGLAPSPSKCFNEGKASPRETCVIALPTIFRSLFGVEFERLDHRVGQ